MAPLPVIWRGFFPIPNFSVCSNGYRDIYHLRSNGTVPITREVFLLIPKTKEYVKYYLYLTDWKGVTPDQITANRPLYTLTLQTIYQSLELQPLKYYSWGQLHKLIAADLGLAFETLVPRMKSHLFEQVFSIHHGRDPDIIRMIFSRYVDWNRSVGVGVGVGVRGIVEKLQFPKEFPSWVTERLTTMIVDLVHDAMDRMDCLRDELSMVTWSPERVFDWCLENTQQTSWVKNLKGLGDQRLACSSIEF